MQKVNVNVFGENSQRLCLKDRSNDKKLIYLGIRTEIRKVFLPPLTNSEYLFSLRKNLPLPEDMKQASFDMMKIHD